MEVLVLGPVEARLAGAHVDLGTPKQRALLCALALSLGRPVAVDTIVDLLWGEEPPPGVSGTLQSYVSGLRRVLEPERERRRPADVLVTVAPGYALRLPARATDAGRFGAVVATQHRQFAATPLVGRVDLSREALVAAVDALDQALGLWRGRPYAELEDAADAAAERARLDDLRLVALEDRAVASLALGHHATVAAELEALTAAHPLRERLWGLRAVALARSGRQAEALESLGTVRAVLSEELGLEPGLELRELQTAVLRQDPRLRWAEPAASAPLPAPIPVQRTSTAMAVAPVGPRAGELVGRADELAVLEALLESAGDGQAAYAAVVGDAGIGKSRLAAELGHRARQRGWHTVVARCSQDQGAPPLWPWAGALTALGSALPTVAAEVGDEGARFRIWEEISRRVREAAAERAVLLVVEDLHWADESSLGALRALVDAMAGERLLVVSTRRTHPGPAGALADLGETAARQHSTLLELAGLDVADAAKVAEQVIGNRPTQAESAALRERTDGNPFFIVEYSRLAGRHGDLGRLLAEENPPTAVQDVLGRRISRLPELTVEALRTAAVIGRRFDAPLLAAATGIHEDDLLDVVEPAQAAGLVREDGIGRYAFAHALVVDTLLSTLRPSRRARVHARVAAALPAGPGHEAELARHWLAAGPAYADRAWRAAVAAAAQSRDLHDHERASRLLRAALEHLDHDETATLRDRYDVLMALIDAHRWTAMWPEMVACVEQAVGVARELGDVELMTEAAISTNQGSLWLSARIGGVHEGIVDAVRECFARLPEGDGPLRCRALLSLANETYYVAPYVERKRLVDEAIAMAERLGDRQLLLEAEQTAFMALWTCETRAARLEHATRALALAREVGSERAAVVSRCLRCVALSELGRPAEMFAEAAEVAVEADRLRLAYGLIVLHSLLLPWLALAGRFDQCEELLERITELDARMSLAQSGDAMVTAGMALQRWRGDDAGVVTVFEEVLDSPFPVNAAIAAARWRAGDRAGARDFAATHPAELPEPDWFALCAWAHAAELSLYLGDADLAARVAALLVRHTGESTSAGGVLASGPVDVYLSLAVAATGDLDAAGRHADRAEELCKAWEIPVVGDWLSRLRTEYAF